MKKIIGFYGIGHSGKATTLNMLIGLFDSQHIAAKTRNVKFVSTINNQIIGIATCGDTESDIADACLYFNKQNCDIAVVATRSKGKSCRRLVDFAKEKHTRIEWVEKKKDYLNQVATNYEQARELRDLLNFFITTKTGANNVN